MSFWVVGFALLLDFVLCEPKRFHPLVGFGHVAAVLERHLNTGGGGHIQALVKGMAAVILLVVPIAVLCYAWRPEQTGGWQVWFFDGVILYFTLGWRSLEKHVSLVGDAVRQGDDVAVRRQAALLVSRDADAMSRQQALDATLESYLENGCDAVFAPVFWYVIAGPAGAVAYRLVNTLDAMWGYKNERFRHFGWFAARFDDAANWLPARATCLTYLLVGGRGVSWPELKTQVREWQSPNAGPVMACGAWAIGIQLGGAAVYHGTTRWRPRLGTNLRSQAGDLERVKTMVRQGLVLWLAIMLLGVQFA